MDGVQVQSVQNINIHGKQVVGIYIYLSSFLMSADSVADILYWSSDIGVRCGQLLPNRKLAYSFVQ